MTSFLETGWELLDDTMRIKGAKFIHFKMTRTETGYTTDDDGNLILENPSGATCRTRWHWSDSSNSGQWSNAFDIYKFKRFYIPSGSSDTFDYGYSVIPTKNKVRGHGTSLSLYIAADSGKDARILGWAISFVGRTED